MHRLVRVNFTVAVDPHETKLEILRVEAVEAAAAAAAAARGGQLVGRNKLLMKRVKLALIMLMIGEAPGVWV